jgi:putative salt-induced outer membrane protein
VKNRAQFIRSSANDVTTANNFLYAFRAERPLNDRIAAFGDYGFLRDEPAGVSRRHAVTGGLAFKIARGPRHTFTADAGAGYLNERRLAGADITSAVYAGGTNYKWALSETADLTSDLRFLGTFENGDDWRAAHTIAVTARLTAGLSLKVSNTVRYANLPPPGFKRTDTTTAVAIVASFKRP